MKNSKSSLKTSKSIFLEEEVDIFQIAVVVRKYLKFLFIFVVVAVFLTAVVLLRMRDIYTSSAVILPVSQEKAVGLPSIAKELGGVGVTSLLPVSTSYSEIIALLDSNILLRKMVEKHDLLPVLLYERWNEEEKRWEPPGFSVGMVLSYFKKVIGRNRRHGAANRNAKGVPTVQDGVRALRRMIAIREEKEKGTIRISVSYPDPEVSEKLARLILDTLRDHMTREVKRVALINKKSLEEQVNKISDPFILQKIYALIAKQIETFTMAEASENFAFKIIDPPVVPDRPSKPKRRLLLIASAAFYCLFGIFAVFFWEFWKAYRYRLEEETGEKPIEKTGDD